MDVHTLRNKYYQHHPDGHYFDPDTLRFFGERWSEMRVLKKPVTVKDYSGKEHECWVLSSVQRPHFSKPHRVYHYFDTSTFEDIIPG